MNTHCIHYEGKVQGVGFRATVLGLARGYDITGGIRNLSDGRVELLARGEEEEVRDFLTAIRESHLAGHIESEQADILDPSSIPTLRGFQILS